MEQARPIIQSKRNQMSEDKMYEFHILNFFRAKDDYASSQELNADLQNNGLPPLHGRTEFELILQRGYLDKERRNNRPVYKINQLGIIRLNRLKDELENEKNPPIVKNFLYAPGNSGPISQISDSSFHDLTQTHTITPNANESTAIRIPWYSKPLFKYIIWPLAVALLAALIIYIVSDYNKPQLQ